MARLSRCRSGCRWDGLEAIDLHDWERQLRPADPALATRRLAERSIGGPPGEDPSHNEA